MKNKITKRVTHIRINGGGRNEGETLKRERDKNPEDDTTKNAVGRKENTTSSTREAS